MSPRLGLEESEEENTRSTIHPSNMETKSDTTLSPSSSSAPLRSDDPNNLISQTSSKMSFLEKTWEMIQTAPPEVAGWSEKGDTFIVYDPEKFAQQMIPKYFRHNKFASFVRQLNFYGFHKVRQSCPKKLIGKGSMGSDDWDEKDMKGRWEFRHDRFVRGNKDLMKTILRKTNMRAQTQTTCPCCGAAKEDAGVTMEGFAELENRNGMLTQYLREASYYINTLSQIVMSTTSGSSGPYTPADSMEIARRALRFTQDSQSVLTVRGPPEYENSPANMASQQPYYHHHRTYSLPERLSDEESYSDRSYPPGTKVKRTSQMSDHSFSKRVRNEEPQSTFTSSPGIVKVEHPQQANYRDSDHLVDSRQSLYYERKHEFEMPHMYAGEYPKAVSEIKRGPGSQSPYSANHQTPPSISQQPERIPYYQQGYMPPQQQVQGGMYPPSPARWYLPNNSATSLGNGNTNPLLPSSTGASQPRPYYTTPTQPAVRGNQPGHPPQPFGYSNQNPEYMGQQ